MKNHTLENTTSNTPNALTKRVIPRQAHSISRQHISPNALKVLYRLNSAGFDAYIVGGGVRDLVLGGRPKDFDVATNATPEQIRKLFRNCRLIGRRFRLAHVMFGREIIEVATFRGHHQENQSDKQLSNQSEEGLLLRDNVYGSIDEDAQRRDFTINAMYYNIADHSIHDYANGMNDIKERLIRLIGHPPLRYQEDPVRMLRAVRFAVKLDFDIEEDTAAPIEHMAHLLNLIPPARLYEESLKMLQMGFGLENYHQMRKYGLFQPLFPCVSRYFTADYHSLTEQMLDLVLDATDQRVEEQKRINPAFMFAAIHWYPLVDEMQRQRALRHKKPINQQEIMAAASNVILDELVKTLAIPRRHTTTIREIWQLQSRFATTSKARVMRILEQAKFRAGFDFLLMRGEIEGGATQELAQWWKKLIEATPSQRQNIIDGLSSSTKRRTTNRSKKTTKA